MEWMLMPLRRYAEFSGRSQRKEYWMFVLFQVIVFIALGLLAVMFGGFGDPTTGEEISAGAMVFIVILGLFALAMFIPNLAVQVRRLHDTDKSGWWILIGLIPIVNYIGSIVLLVFFCLEGTKGDNKFGTDPKMNENVGEVFR
ncbi:DUF805 domain-containing protein [Parasphingorhabdus halotolerans]|uniref:DUF805 domain-containing protein n=1 Tax=Parasphingorhabdus halotolerans TaxID=2725558 RepID=A0A6H2DL01_9SPHN|nr:DUF805 domain-containing protein [Parasphingorhabdus halotolerans]QJB68663.1 DUF805 domain-containing protein [Parasphingorhabdus halotolerans]